MQHETIQALRSHAAAIRKRWSVLLRVELTASPLANAEAFDYLIPESLEEIFDALATSEDQSLPPLPQCPGRCNPYKGYFIAAERALSEAFLAVRSNAARHRDPEWMQLLAAIRTLAANEVEAFCGICTLRGNLHVCRFAPSAVEAEP